jgi:branched-chain amino acid transport system ATP-binding protein
LLLKVEDIDVYYGSIPAIRDVSLEADDGQIVALIGANGAGKSTTLKTIIGVLGPKKGRILYNESDVTKLAAHQRVRLGISLVPEGRQIFSRLTVIENLILGAYHRNDREKVQEDLEWVYRLFPILHERKNQIGGTLSGGEQQMLALGRGLMSHPNLLLLDEPSLGLAPMIASSVHKAIKEINQGGVTILLVEQNVGAALNLADYLYVMETGTCKVHGKPKQVMKSDEIRKAYLGG